MGLESKVLQAQTNQKLCEQLISEYHSFIMSCASRAIGRFVTPQDDEASIAMIAFYEAITKYIENKGSFLSFASLIIESRLIDYTRKGKRTLNEMPFSSLSYINSKGKETEFDAEDTFKPDNDIRYEIEALTRELNKLNITFSELAKVSPKSKKTRLACFKAIKFIMINPFLTVEFKKSFALPVKRITEHTGINEKTLERHRKYIVAGLIVLTGKYEGIAEYFKGVKEVIL